MCPGHAGVVGFDESRDSTTRLTTVSRESDETHRRALQMAQALLCQQDDVIDVLTRTATCASARDELCRSITALAGAAWEVSRSAPQRVDRIGVFLPSNNLLYSYVLYSLIPSLYTTEVLIRSSARVRETVWALNHVLRDALGPQLDGVHLTNATQREFVGICRDADAIVFTGQYGNALNVMAALGDKPLFLLFGSGPNPIVLGPETDVRDAVRTVLAARLYNSGQDCLCADIVFVSRSVLSPVLDQLTAALDLVRVGDRRDPDTIVAPLVYADAFHAVSRFLDAHRDRIVYGGQMDADTMSVAPTVVLLPANHQFHPDELFAPVFCVVPYDDPAFLTAWADSPVERERGMYTTVLGELRLADDRLGSSVVCTGASPFDLENGNQPFGGYGCRASSMGRNGRLEGMPLLLSAQIAARQRKLSAETER